MSIVPFLIGLPIGVVCVLVYYYGSDWLYHAKSKRDPEKVFVSSKLNQPGLRIPVNNVNDTLAWLDDGDKP